MKLNHSTKKLRYLCNTYRVNRNKQSDKFKWNKQADLDKIFDELKSLGLKNVSSSAGFIAASYDDGTSYYVNIGKNRITTGKTKKGIFEWLETVKE